jgi:hypothetical protein
MDEQLERKEKEKARWAGLHHPSPLEWKLQQQ